MNLIKPCFRVNLILLLAISAAACAPKFYQRTTVAVETGDDDGVQVRYGELDSCLLRQQVPVEYVVRRPRYTLQIRPVPGLQAPPRLELRLQAGSEPTLQFPDLQQQPQALFAEQGVRYLVETSALNNLLNLKVLRGQEELGRERFRLTPDHCRVMSPT
jgi:hypothetical protein